MRQFQTVPEEIQQNITSRIAKKRFPQCLLITGGTAQQRRKTAEYVAAALECTASSPPCGKCRACVKTLAQRHPDVYCLEAGGKSESVKLEDVRGIRETCYLLPNEGNAKVYYFPQAERIRPEGQNALLKIMEEPPQNVYFLLCVQVRASMLPTVLSRAEELSLGESETVDISAKTEQKLQQICPVVCEALAAKLQQICPVVCEALAAGNEYALMTALAPLEKDRNAISRCAAQLQTMIAEALTGSGTEPAVLRLRENMPAEELLAMIEVLRTVMAACERNANGNLLLSLFSSHLMGCRKTTNNQSK